MLPNGEPLPDQEMTYHVAFVLEGESGDAEHGHDNGESGCHVHGSAKHATARRIVTVEGGAFQVLYLPHELVPISHEQCPIERFTIQEIASLRVTASIPSSRENCELICGDENCVNGCTSPERPILARARYSAQQVQQMASTQDDGSIHLPINLLFDTPGPRISDIEGVDLQVNQDTLARSIEFDETEFDPSSCAVQEGCLGGPGKRKLLRFDSEIMNLGGSDLRLGNPGESPEFEFSSCHEHYHRNGIMTYELVNPSGQVVAVGRKQGFCLMDTVQVAGESPGGYGCESQGITSGWSDIYDRGLDCQWLDVTDVAPGDYKLRLTVNPLGEFEETDRSNNFAEVPVTISP